MPNTLRILLSISLFIITMMNNVYAVDFFEDEKIIWQSGSINYVGLDTIEKNASGKNQHPQSISEQNLRNALSAIVIWEKDYLESTEELEKVLSPPVISKLSKFLSKGLAKAKPDEDLVFSFISTKPKLVFLKQKFYTAGRVFYKDDKLNLIIGQYRVGLNDAFENTLDPSGSSRQTYRFNYGTRSTSINSFNEKILLQEGISNKRKNKETRTDWFVIDVESAAESYLARKEQRENPKTARDKQFEIEAAKIAKERREMRLEMARLRKEMKEGGSSSSSALTVEQRLENLDSLYGKGLVTEDEYKTKREEILNDI